MTPAAIKLLRMPQKINLFVPRSVSAITVDPSKCSNPQKVKKAEIVIPVSKMVIDIYIGIALVLLYNK